MQTKFCVNGSIIEGDLKIAEEFNKFFSEIGPSLASEIKPINTNQHVQSFLRNNSGRNFSFSLSNQNEILDIINSLADKPSCGIDNLNSKFIKTIKNQILYPL